MTLETFNVLAISQNDYKEQLNIAKFTEDSHADYTVHTVHTDYTDYTDYTILISSNYFEKFIKEEIDTPLSIMITFLVNDNDEYKEEREIVCGSIGILDGNILGDDYIVMPDEYFRKLQIESFTSVKIRMVNNIKKINYIKIRGHDERYISWDGINEILEAHLNKFRAISSGQTTNVLGINFTIMEMKDCDGNIITYGSLYETDVNIEFDDLEPRVPVKTIEEILQDNERTYIDENGNSIKYDVDNIIENVKYKYRNWRLTF